MIPLEANRNKRCFIFEHCPYFVSGGSPSVITEGDGVVEGWPAPTGGYINSQNHIFMNLVKHYKNVVWFHGHTHQPPNYQVECSTVNYNKRFGFHSMHIP